MSEAIDATQLAASVDRGARSTMLRRLLILSILGAACWLLSLLFGSSTAHASTPDSARTGASSVVALPLGTAPADVLEPVVQPVVERLVTALPAKIDNANPHTAKRIEQIATVVSDVAHQVRSTVSATVGKVLAKPIAAPVGTVVSKPVVPVKSVVPVNSVKPVVTKIVTRVLAPVGSVAHRGQPVVSVSKRAQATGTKPSQSIRPAVGLTAETLTAATHVLFARMPCAGAGDSGTADAAPAWHAATSAAPADGHVPAGPGRGGDALLGSVNGASVSSTSSHDGGAAAMTTGISASPVMVSTTYLLGGHASLSSVPLRPGFAPD